MTTLWLALAAATLAESLPTAAGPATVENGLWWSSSLQLRAIADIEKNLSVPMSDKFLVRIGETPASVRTCRDFLGIATKSFDTEDDAEWKVIWYQGMRCLALDWLGKAKPAPQTFLGAFNWSKIDLSDLPPELGLQISPEATESVKKASATCKSLRNVEASARITRRKGDEITVRGAGWSGTITLLGRGDFDGDGVEDLMVKRMGAVERGTAAESSLFLLTKTSERGCLRVVRRAN